MPELDLSKEINIAIKAALLSGKHLKKNKIELNKTHQVIQEILN